MAQGELDDVVLEALLRLQEASSMPMAVFDDDDRMRWSNPAFRAAYRVEPGAALRWSDIMRACHATRQGAVRGR